MQATLLYIEITNTFLTMNTMTDNATGQIKHRVRTMVAGTIMTSTVNAMLVVALGLAPEAHAEEPAKPAEANKV